jgi:hypothetical protein
MCHRTAKSVTIASVTIGIDYEENPLMTRLIAVFGAGIALLPLLGVCAASPAAELNDFPTSARVDYVFGCMKANGETQDSLQRCSCSVDVVASLLPYDRYITAETVLSMAQEPGNLGGEFRSTDIARSAVEDLRRAQAEAEIRCF